MENWENEGGSVQQPMQPYVPPWACTQYGNYGHDWLDCYACQQKYEEYLEDEQTNQTENSSH